MSLHQKILYKLNPSFRLLQKITNKLDSQTNLAKEQKSLTNSLIDITKLPQAQGTLRELQLVNVYILKEIKKICEQLDITFWLHGGSLLGAVRHGGFIPWDDDIDIGMMRKDFFKLKEHLKTSSPFEIKDFYFLKTIFAKQPRIVFKGGYLPFFVDIFVYDECFSDSLAQSWQNLYLKKIEQIQRIKATKICHNTYHCIDNSTDLNIIEQIYDSYIPLSEENNSNCIIFNLDAGLNLIKDNKENSDAFIRIFEKDFIFPLKKLKFEGIEFNVPQNYIEYLIKQYGDYMSIPQKFEVSPHLINSSKTLKLLIHQKFKEITSYRTIGYTAGAFDVFHIGHLNLLKRAKQNCDYLIVGVTTDELIHKTKNKWPVSCLSERMEIISSIKFVDEVVIQDDLDKFKAWEKYNYDTLFSGDDWKNNDRWKTYEERLSAVGVSVIYFPYTDNISSSKIQNFILKSTKDSAYE